MGDGLRRLDQVRFGEVRGLFRSAHVGLVADAVLAGTAPGRVWVDAGDVPRSVFMWDGGHNFYLAGQGDEAFGAGVRQLFAEEVRVEGKEKGLGSFKVNCDDPKWDGRLEGMFETLVERGVGRCFLRLGRLGSERVVPEGFELRVIDAALLDSGLAGVAGVREEVESMWGTVAAFVAGGLGIAVLGKGQIVCWCTAEYVSPGRCGIGIETVEEYRGRGLATAAAAEFCRRARGRGWTPHWDSWADNKASLAVARRAGFERVEEYEVGWGRF